MAKLFASETRCTVTDEAMQILGRQRLHTRLSGRANAPGCQIFTILKAPARFNDSSSTRALTA